MIRNKCLLLLSFIFSLTLQVSAQRSNDTPDKAIESIVGKWQLQKVYAGRREITTNPNSDRTSWIEFNEDGTYSQQTEDGDHRGSYRLNENHSTLYLESEERKETSSAVSLHNLTEYNISLKDGILSMLSKGENAAPTKFVYAKADSENGSN